LFFHFNSLSLKPSSLLFSKPLIFDSCSFSSLFFEPGSFSSL
jgi:hypothetical protein